MEVIHLDFETTSACDIGLGHYRYAADPSTRILLFAVSDGGPPLIWRFDEPSEEAKQMLDAAIKRGALIYAHNAPFEMAVSHYRMREDVGIDPPAIEQWRCTKVMALRAAIPASLAGAAEFLKLTDKDKAGKALINIFSDQTKITTLSRGAERLKVMSPILHNPIPWDWQVTVAGEHITVREAWNRFIEYCRKDVVVEQEIHAKLARFELSGFELDGFQFDLRMNHRGIPINRPALTHAQHLIDEQESLLVDEFKNLTGLMPSQTAKVLEWLRFNGYAGEDLKAESMEQQLGSSFLTPEGDRALKIRSLLSFAAVKKVSSMLETACPDDMMRGLFQFNGAQKTRRWTASGPQPQNARKPSIRFPDDAYASICSGMSREDILCFHGDIHETVASVVRNFMQPHGGKRMLSLDLSNIESRIGALLAECEQDLEMYRNGRDLYKDLAASTFGVPYERVTKDQRFVGKVGILSCIAEGELVLTDAGLIPIEKVSSCQRVWDGVEWVRHDGVIFKGYREIVHYDGLRATEDHEVFVSEEGHTRKVCLRDAILSQKRIIRSGSGGQAIRISDSVEQRSCSDRRTAGILHSCAVRLWERVSRVLRKPDCREIHSVQDLLLQGETLPEMVGESSSCSDRKMHKPKKRRLQKLRWSRDRVPVCEHVGSMHVDCGEPGSPQRDDAGSDRQQWSLREGESSVDTAVFAGSQHANVCFERPIHSQAVAVFSQRGKEKTLSRDVTGRDYPRRLEGGSGETQELAEHQGKVRVYDILNAGPRHRFTVSDRLVSNCVFQTGAKKFHETCAAWGQPVEKSVAIRVVRSFRSTKPEYPTTWKAYEQAMVNAVKNPGQWFPATQWVKFARTLKEPFDRLIMRLPSGGEIIYPMPQIRTVTKKHKDFETGETREFEGIEFTFYGSNQKTRQWGRQATYAGSVYQSSVQGTARDVMLHGCLQAQQKGFDIWALIHDEALADDGDIDEFHKAFTAVPAWLPQDFPLAAESGRQDYYKKD